MGHPSQCIFENLVCDRLLQNCPIIVHNVTNAYNSFGPDLASITPEYVEIPQGIIEQNKMVTLMADIIFINGIPFLITYGRGVGLITVEWIPNRTKRQLALNIIKVLQLYARGGFTVHTILMDTMFEKVRDLVHMMNIKISATNEHVGEVETQIRTIKERCHGILGALPFLHLPQQLIIGLMQFVTMWLNAFPSDTGIAGR